MTAQESAGSSPFDRLRVTGDPVLHRQASPVSADRFPLTALIERMLAVMAANDGVGLAAPQIGVSLRVFVARVGRTTVAVANPVLEPAGAMYDHAEGCLSLPAAGFTVPRYPSVALTGVDALTGRRMRLELAGFDAAAAQHEVDHLNGILISDRR